MPVLTTAILGITTVTGLMMAAGAAIAVAGIGLQVIAKVTKSKLLGQIGKIMGYVGMAVGFAGGIGAAVNASGMLVGTGLGEAVGVTGSNSALNAANAAGVVAQVGKTGAVAGAGAGVVPGVQTGVAGSNPLSAVGGTAAPGAPVTTAPAVAGEGALTASGTAPVQAPIAGAEALTGTSQASTPALSLAKPFLQTSTKFASSLLDQAGGAAKTAAEDSFIPAWMKQAGIVGGVQSLGGALGGLFAGESADTRLKEEKRQFNLIRADRNSSYTF